MDRENDPASSVEVRRTFTNGVPFYRVYDGGRYLEIFDYLRNAMRFAKDLNKGPVRYVRNGAIS
jgi:hypothetical protein